MKKYLVTMRAFKDGIKITCVWELDAVDEVTAKQTVDTPAERAHWPIAAVWTCVPKQETLRYSTPAEELAAELRLHPGGGRG